MKKTLKKNRPELQLMFSWSNSYYLDWIEKLEKLLRKRPRSIHVDFIGTGEITPDTALLIRSTLMKRSPRTRIVTNARSSLQGGAVMLWLLGDKRIIRDDARIFFRRADLPEDAEVDPNANWNHESAWRDSVSEVDPDEGDYERVLQIIDEFLPVKEFAGRLIGVSVLKQFGLIENEGVDNYLTTAFSKSRPSIAFRRNRR